MPGFAIDRMCAGAMTAVTTTAGGIAFGAYDVAIAGGVEHMGRHPMGEGVDPNPRIVVREAGRPVGARHGLDRREPARPLPHLTKERADAFAVASQQQDAKAYANGKIQPTWCRSPTRVGRGAAGAWPPSTSRRARGTTLDDLAALKTPFRPHGRVTAGNAAGLNDGATGCLLAAEDVARRARPAGPDAAGRRTPSPASSPR